MKYFSLKADTKGISNLLIIFVFMLMSNVSVFGQSAQKLVDANAVEVNSNAKKENVSATSSNSMNFVLWFMGTKQGPNGTISKESTSAKIQVITSGSAPNRLLIKAFLKKAVDSDSMIS
ncbi:MULTISPECIES: hypothetical protein [Flavobacterium]|uniref:Uncharacterized protein n=1 Tax=Flavobacterium ranwuense TaxID=2541725 RepID=A0ABY2DSF6_9FLAO|nr:MULTISPECIES: hypothetical protein [Flavobacterium]TDE29831.1 hypothetical protein E0I61_07610 [Flavobacterium ranwuense]TDE54311.1 hypothetical protein E0H99_05560 [Flavobacterium sp. GT3P67]